MNRSFLQWIPALLMLSLTTVSIADESNKRLQMQTNLGNIILELDTTQAPLTVKNFMRYADEGFYNGTVFHRVIGGFMIQGGGYGSDYVKKPTHEPIVNEANNGLKNERGTIAMARTRDPHSATAQFYINHVDNPNLDFKNEDIRGWGYTVFGRVVEGMDVVDKIADQPTDRRDGALQNVPTKPVIIERVSAINEATPGSQQ